MMGPHKNLEVWRKSMLLTEEIYRITKSFPREELFGLVSQMRRAAVSVPSNIAEGYGRSSNAEVLHFLYIALGSSNELDTQMLISRQQSFFCEDEYAKVDGRNEEVNKVLSSLIHKRSRL